MKTEIQLQTTTIRNVERNGSTTSDNTNVDVLNFTKEEILKMTDAEIKSKILPSIWYEKSSECGMIFDIVEVVFQEETEEENFEIIYETYLKNFTYIEDGAWVDVHKMSDLFKD